MEADISVIEHLIDIEQEAASLLFDAQTEADNRVKVARTAADSEYKKGYEVMISEMEASFADAKAITQQKHDEEFNQYKDSVNNFPKDTAGFETLLESMLFGE